MTAPKRIWAGRYHGTWWQSTPHHQMTEYIRADLVQALVEALRQIEQCDEYGIDAHSPQDLARAALSAIGEGGE